MEQKRKKNKQNLPTAESIILESGHSLHVRLIHILEESGYGVEISPYYVDGFSDKPREIDIVARKKIKISAFGSAFVELVFSIESKHLKQNTVFWSFPNLEGAQGLKMLNIDQEKIIKGAGGYAFLYQKEHFVARLFQTGKDDRESQISEPIYKAISQAVNGLIFAQQGAEQKLNPTIFHALVVVGGPGKFYDASNPKKAVDRVLLHLDYSYYLDRNPNKKSTREQFYVLIVREEYLMGVLEILEKEVLSSIAPILDQEKAERQFYEHKRR